MIPHRIWPRIRLGECIVMNKETYSQCEEWPFVNYLDTGSITDNRIEAFQRLDTGDGKLPSRARRKVQTGDIVFSTVRPNQRHFGLLRDIPENFLASTGFAVFHAREDIADTGFLYWFLAQDQIVERLQTIAEHSTSAYPAIRPTDICELEIDLPPLPEQRAIAHILGTLDDKIQLNRQMNRTLEAISRTIFKDWFVDFGPVRAKMEGRDPYLPSEIWELFPDRFVKSELGDIPKGWEVKSLDQIAHFQNGLALQKFRPSLHEARLPVVKIKQLRSGVTGEEEWASASINPQCIINDGDVVFSWSGSLLVRVWGGGEAALNQHLFKVTSERYPKWLYLYSLLQHLPHFQRIAADKATTMGHIRRHHLSSALCVIPPEHTITKMTDLLGDLIQIQVVNNVACHTLANLRDTLLPKLISGEIRLTEAENALQHPEAEKRKYQNSDLAGQILKSPKSVVIVGLSTDERKDSHVVAKFLQSKGIRIIPVHPQADLILGEKVYRQVADITKKVDIVNVFRPSHECPQYAEQAVQIGAKVLWLQLGIFSEEAAEIAREAGMAVIMNLCIKVEYSRHYPSIISSE